VGKRPSSGVAEDVIGGMECVDCTLCIGPLGQRSPVLLFLQCNLPFLPVLECHGGVGVKSLNFIFDLLLLHRREVWFLTVSRGSCRRRKGDVQTG